MLTASKPWISSEDIQKGATWITGIKEALTESKGIGVFFATREALSSPWLNFEAGAIASLGAQRVCVVCVDIEPGEMSPPLSLFQSTRIEREDIFKLLKTLNGQLVEPSTDAVLAKIFDRSWAELDEAIKQVLTDTERASKKSGRKPSPDQVIADIASGVQRIESRLSALETASRSLPVNGLKVKAGNPSRWIFRTPAERAEDFKGVLQTGLQVEVKSESEMRELSQLLRAYERWKDGQTTGPSNPEPESEAE